MNTYADKKQDINSQSVANEVSQKQGGSESALQFAGKLPEAIAQRRLQELASNSVRMKQLGAFQEMATNKKGGMPVKDRQGSEHEPDVMNKKALQMRRPGDKMAGADIQLSAYLVKPGQAITPERAFRQAVLPANPVVQCSFTYTASVVLDRVTAEKKEAKDFKIEKISLPGKKRPPTQFGGKQMAHAVSWTLLTKAYEAAKDITLDKFITDYLEKDWTELARQKDMGKVEKSHILFNSYLKKYDKTYFEGLKAEKISYLQWYGRIQTAITDYFIALQLAPLSTHTGFTQQIGKPEAGLKEAQPSGHGEPQANAFFLQLETDLKAKKDGPPSPETVVKHAAWYWDPGIGMSGGINESEHVDLISEEFLLAIKRAYPETWAKYEDAIKAGITEKAKKAVAEFSGKGHSAPGKAAADTDDADVDDADAGGFQTNLDLSVPSGAGGAISADQFMIREYEIKEIALPDDRPVTKYGPAGQKSHTVSWTVVLKSLQNLGQNKDLKTFLQALLLKWIALQNQDWESMLATDLIARSDYSNPPYQDTINRQNIANKARLTELHKKIAPHIAQLAEAVSGVPKSDTQWSKFVQQCVSDYVLVYQSSPLTTYKVEKQPKGHDEAGANEWFAKMEEGDPSQKKWENKFLSLFDTPRAHLNYTKTSWKGEKDDPEITNALKIANKIRKNKKALTNRNRAVKKAEETGSTDPIPPAKTEAVTPEELAKIKKILVKNLGTNYLDAGWKAVLKEGAADLDYSPKELARILVEWEETMKEAYPTIWASYQAEFEAHTEKTKLSKGLLEQQAVKKGGAIGDLGADDKIMKSWVIGERNNRAYAKGLVAIKAGDESEGEGHYKLAKTQYNAGRVAAQADTPLDLASSDAFKHGYQDYEQGRTDAEADPVRPLPGGHNLAYNVAYKEYLEGYQAASNTPDTALADNSRKAYTAGYNAYRNGYLAARAQPGVALAVPLSPAYTTAYTEYQNGYQAALAMPGVILFGGHSAAYMKAYNDFQQGYSAAVATPDAPMAHSPSQAYTNGYAQYKNGYEAAVATPLVVLAGLHPQAYTNGYIHYRNGYLNAFQNAGLPIFIHRAYQLGDAAGTNQRHANQNAVNSGKRRKF